ncbi:hypothetical protein [Treponema pedis]|uniref:hypothetical protein n=1 Tax=Treponema pedis TaxID=409322 RepID=UPI001981CD1F|nr:hypothetical protein [Treponema pedis]QSI05206.1 hypothetical protein DYQ05_09930 [Treponema pedis]
MWKKELTLMLKNPVYAVMPILPFLLTFFMSEGTKNYILRNFTEREAVYTAAEVIIYRGPLLTAQMQFAISELSFILMMCAIPAGLNIFEERHKNIWNRVVCKRRFLTVKFLLHFVFAVIITAVSLALFYLIYNIKIPFTAATVFLSIPVLSILFGLAMGLTVQNRTVLSNSIMMIVMLLGYLGGALSLTSVLSSTKYMNVLMYLSPLTLADTLIFRQLLGYTNFNGIMPYITVHISGTVLCLTHIIRKVRNDSIL